MNKGRPNVYESITYEELGDFIGKRGLVKVSKPWLDSLMGELAPSKAQEALSKTLALKPEPTSKECSKCNRLLPLHDFSNDKRRKLGKRSQCKDCNKGCGKVTTEEELPKIEFTLTTFDE